MNDRQYLRSLGFIVGERGRFSKEMLEALQNRHTTEKVVETGEAQTVAPLLPVRAAQSLYGQTQGGSRVEFMTCSSCAFHMMWCRCTGGVVAPDNVVSLEQSSSTIAQLHPRMLHLTPA